MKSKMIFLGILLTSLLVLWGDILNKTQTLEQEEFLENVELAIYLNEEKTNTIPSKEGNIYDEVRSSCSNDAYIIWDYETWSPVVKNVKTYPTRCSLYFKTGYKEEILNGTDPVLKDELIPVTIESNGIVKKADLGSAWYSYEEKRWANAVILKNPKDYLAGEIIPEENIESYFVWIPKYRYQLWDLGNYDGVTNIDTSKVHEIPILFGDYNTSDSKENECTTPMESGATGNCKVGDYMTHPAFLSIPSTGFWVGKFETGYDGATTKEEAEQNIQDPNKVIIKPNVYSWRGIQVANAFYTSYNYKRNLDSHMMKNTEWGAVAYLQHSKYGSGTSVRINNNSNNMTGYQANNEPTCGFTNINEECNKYCSDGSCNTAYPNSVLASTTNNISGVFDMSGGSWEHMMGVTLDQEGKPLSGRNSLSNSGFNGAFGCPTCDNDTSGLTSLTDGYAWPEEKYYDAYTYSNKYLSYKNAILGDATAEVGPFVNDEIRHPISSWYKDYAVLVFASFPIHQRGSTYESGTEGGTFAFGPNGGASSYNVSFRIILTI